MKPGDVVKALNGTHIKIENTDKEGQVIMADVLYYSKNYKPCLVASLATISSKYRQSPTLKLTFPDGGCSAATTKIDWTSK